MKEVVSLLKSLILPEENKQSNSSIIIDPKGIRLSEKSDEIYNSKIENISLNISEKSVVTDDFSDLTIENIQIIDENKSENSLSSHNQNTTQLNVTYPVSSDISYTNKFKELGKKIFLDPLKYIYFKLYEYDLPKSVIIGTLILLFSIIIIIIYILENLEKVIDWYRISTNFITGLAQFYVYTLFVSQRWYRREKRISNN